ncbi:MAG: cysteine--tRNA ligase [Alphaproteobacteria bacterium]|nr:cysteine--tRNA ligase [Alphaproteobacteria bacterium]
MKTLSLYNSLTNAIEEFKPIDSEHVKMYACGPTVYASPHIGNARPLVIVDVLFRVLQRLYKRVSYVRNVTDVDDKINKRAQERGISIRQLTDEVLAEFHRNIEFLNILPTTVEPRATFHVPDMLQFIQRLVDKGFAYQSNGHVLFRVKALNQYGMLSKRSVEDMIPGSRVEIASYKEDPLDFVLWKPSKEGEPFWDSQFGAGRPGWHIECSVMSSKYLGKCFDIHAGGQDLIFPHHENEIAQNFGAFGCLMANYWIHNGLLLVDNQKMSKSVGNIISLKDILGVYDGEIVRYALLSSHYQKTLNWTDQLVLQAKHALNRMYGALSLRKNIIVESAVPNSVLDALCSNLNTPLALSQIGQIVDQIFKSSDQNEIDELCTQLKNSANLLGLLQRTNWFKQATEIPEKEIEKLIFERNLAKQKKDYAKADEIRNHLLSKHIKIEDTKNGTTWKVC